VHVGDTLPSMIRVRVSWMCSGPRSSKRRRPWPRSTGMRWISSSSLPSLGHEPGRSARGCRSDEIPRTRDRPDRRRRRGCCRGNQDRGAPCRGRDPTGPGREDPIYARLAAPEGPADAEDADGLCDQVPGDVPGAVLAGRGSERVRRGSWRSDRCGLRQLAAGGRFVDGRSERGRFRLGAQARR